MNKNMSNDCSNHNFRSISTNITMHYVFSINNLKEKKIEENGNVAWSYRLKYFHGLLSENELTGLSVNNYINISKNAANHVGIPKNIAHFHMIQLDNLPGRFTFPYA